ncbi:MAG: sigma-70 family RNA polymerase sigma factor [Ignavibacteria bacterium]|nr:sigma-70 family RNA polymerase sigma factor [Ignavibacteria bacterium]
MPKHERSQKHKDFEEEALPHLDLLFNFARKMTNSSEDASDLVQETYLKAYRFWHSYEKGTNIKAWLFRILRNTYINRYRKESKGPDEVDFESVQNLNHKSNGHGTPPLDQALGSLMEDDVSTAIASLPDDFRTVVILCDIEGLSYEEIAEFVECPIGTVRSRLHRGRRFLRTQLLEYARKRGYANKSN